VTGIFLTMHYKPDGDLAFASVEHIMRDVDWGWLIRYLHSTGASAFFIVVYLHMFRALIYGSYQKPRELIWIFGMFIFLALMAEAFMGYLLPWGQMSYWGAQVIISLFGAIPFVGDELTLWIRGDFVISDATLNRFFALHVIAVPLVLLMLVVMHIIALHEVGSNNPDGVEIKKNKDENGIPLDGIPFHPYYTVKDIVGVVVFLILFSVVVFFMPEMGGYFLEYANFVPADQFKRSSPCLRRLPCCFSCRGSIAAKSSRCAIVRAPSNCCWLCSSSASSGWVISGPCRPLKPVPCSPGCSASVTLVSSSAFGGSARTKRPGRFQRGCNNESDINYCCGFTIACGRLGRGRWPYLSRRQDRNRLG
jgi:hypothetical protein